MNYRGMQRVQVVLYQILGFIWNSSVQMLFNVIAPVHAWQTREKLHQTAIDKEVFLWLN